jgi:hypothetical protein
MAKSSFAQTSMRRASAFAMHRPQKAAPSALLLNQNAKICLDLDQP